MAIPTTTDAFLQLVRKSGFVDGPLLTQYLKSLGSALPPERKVKRLARLLVQDGLLTNFQAEQLVCGRWKGYAIGSYRIVERIAVGGMGTVYLAEHVHLPQRVAIKILPTALARNTLVVERFYREARSAFRLDHPNIVRGHDVNCQGGTHYLVMEFIDGVNLQELVERRGPLPLDRAVHYISQAAQALDYAHVCAGMVHRDIKPANFMLDRTGMIKLLDMGLARVKPGAFFISPSEQITRNHNDHSVLGTADYIAPEQALDSQSADGRTDLYSLGGTFYFLLTGLPPFPGGAITQKLMAHQLTPAPTVRARRPDVPEEINELIARLLAKNPVDRPQSAAEVVDTLHPWLQVPLSPPDEADFPSLCRAAQGFLANSSLVSLAELPVRTPIGLLSDRMNRTGAETAGSQQLDTDSVPPPPANPLPERSSPCPVQPARRPVASAERVRSFFKRLWFGGAFLGALSLGGGLAWCLLQIF